MREHNSSETSTDVDYGKRANIGKWHIIGGPHIPTRRVGETRWAHSLITMQNSTGQLYKFGYTMTSVESAKALTL